MIERYRKSSPYFARTGASAKTRPARLVCDFGDSGTSSCADATELAELGDCNTPSGPFACDDSTATPVVPALCSTSCSETLASEDMPATEVPWPRKLVPARSSANLAARAAVGRPPEPQAKAVPVRQVRTTLQPSHAARSTQRQPKRAASAKQPQRKPDFTRSSGKAGALKDAATQTIEKPRNPQKPGKSAAAKPSNCPAATTKNARTKTPRGRASRTASCSKVTRPVRSTRLCKMSRSFSAPTISATQKCKAQDTRRAQSAEPSCHRRCVACLVAKISSMSWPPSRSGSPGGCLCCAARSKLARKAKSRSQSRQKMTVSSAEKSAEAGAETQTLRSSSQDLAALAQLVQLSRVACLDGAVQTNSSAAGPWLETEQYAPNSELAGVLVKQMPEAQSVPVSDDTLAQQLPCIPRSWMCVRELTRMRHLTLGGKLPDSLLVVEPSPGLVTLTQAGGTLCRSTFLACHVESESAMDQGARQGFAAIARGKQDQLIHVAC